MRTFPRETVKDDVVDGYCIPAGNTVWVSPWVVQRDERFWDAPEEFDPSRWGERGRDDRHPFAYFPFSGGPRGCLGDRFAMMEASVVLATLLRDYSLQPVPRRDLELAPAITLRPAGNWWQRERMDTYFGPVAADDPQLRLALRRRDGA